MQLVFDDQAIADLENIFAWIAQDTPATARAVIDRLFASIELLISFPRMGHVGRDPDTLEWVVLRLPYIVVTGSIRRVAHPERAGAASPEASFCPKNA